MTWQVQLALRGDLQKFMDADVRAGKLAVTSVIKTRTTALKNNIRKQIKGSGLKERLGPGRLQKSVQSIVYPERGRSFDSAGIVYSKAVYKRPGGLVDLLSVFDSGTVINSNRGKLLAIPVSPRVQGPGVRGDPFSRSPSGKGSYILGGFAFKPSRSSTNPNVVGVLVFAQQPTQVAYILMKQVRIKGNRIDIAAAYEKALQGIDVRVATAWERYHSRVTTRFDIAA